MKVDVLESLSFTVESTMDWQNGLVSQDYLSIKDEIAEEVKILEERGKNPSMLGITTGLDSLDQLTDGWQKGELSILAARPSVGKTALMIKWMLDASKKGKKPLFPLEMGHAQIRKRILAQYTDLDSNTLKRGVLTSNQWKTLYEQSSALIDLPIYIDATSYVPLNQLRGKARKLRHNVGLDIILIDYLQLMDSEDRRFPNREQEIAYISRSLKSLAIELNVPIIVGSQLSRAIESRGDYKFRLSDLRESGAIEQDTDKVFYLHRPAHMESPKIQKGTI